MRGWYENKAAWTYRVCRGLIPLYPSVVNSWTNPKVLDVLNGKYGTGISQKGILSMDFPTDGMIRKIIAVIVFVSLLSLPTSTFMARVCTLHLN